jgi:hypothetical protein
MQLLLPDEVYAIVGAAMQVHTELGCGFLEAVYQEAMELELTAAGIPFEACKELSIFTRACRSKRSMSRTSSASGRSSSSSKPWISSRVRRKPRS